MSKLDYSDLYRFLVSLGVILIALALIIPWLFLSEPFDINLKISDISDLTLTAQTIIAYRQNTVLWFIRNSIVISSFLFIGGISLLIYGMVLWAQKKQYVLDISALLENELLQWQIREIKKRLEPLTVNQIAQKGIEKSISETVPANVQKNNLKESLRIENTFINKLTECFGKEYLLKQQSVQGVPLDVILVHKDPIYFDTIFDIRTVTSCPDDQTIENMLHHFTRALSAYMESVNRTAVLIAVFFYTEEVKQQGFITKVSERIRKNYEKYGQVKPYYVPYQNLSSLDCDSLTKEVLSRAIQKPDN